MVHHSNSFNRKTSFIIQFKTSTEWSAINKNRYSEESMMKLRKELEP